MGANRMAEILQEKKKTRQKKNHYLMYQSILHSRSNCINSNSSAHNKLKARK